MLSAQDMVNGNRNTPIIWGCLNHWWFNRQDQRSSWSHQVRCWEWEVWEVQAAAVTSSDKGLPYLPAKVDMPFSPRPALLRMGRLGTPRHHIYNPRLFNRKITGPVRNVSHRVLIVKCKISHGNVRGERFWPQKIQPGLRLGSKVCKLLQDFETKG